MSSSPRSSLTASGTSTSIVLLATLTTEAEAASNWKVDVGSRAVILPSTVALMLALSTEIAMATPRLPSWNTAVSAADSLVIEPLASTSTLPCREVIEVFAPSVVSEVSELIAIASVSAYSTQVCGSVVVAPSQLALGWARRLLACADAETSSVVLVVDDSTTLPPAVIDVLPPRITFAVLWAMPSPTTTRICVLVPAPVMSALIPTAVIELSASALLSTLTVPVPVTVVLVRLISALAKWTFTCPEIGDSAENRICGSCCSAPRSCALIWSQYGPGSAQAVRFEPCALISTLRPVMVAPVTSTVAVKVPARIGEKPPTIDAPSDLTFSAESLMSPAWKPLAESTLASRPPPG